MVLDKFRLALVAFAVAGFLALLLFVALSGIENRPDRPTVGERRDAILKQLTKHYLDTNPGAKTRQIAGEQMAPPAFLNKELKSRGETWRIRVDGETVEIFNVG